MSDTPLLEFPTDYPIKVVGRASGRLREDADAIVARHVPGFDTSRATERLSASGNFLSISYLIRAESAGQITALAADLSACESILLTF